jgi:4'-phosphopantetheinyl transferase
LFRSIISKKLHQEPINVVIKYDIRNKPRLLGNPYYFNISHTKDAFAFVVSKSFYVGIDIEKTDRSIDILPIVKSYFSIKEQRFILSSATLMHDNFTLLWTRKEALLKAIGIGIVDNLSKIEVSEKKNFISSEIIDNTLQNTIFNDHYIFSEKVRDYFISIAIPQKTVIKMYQINAANIISYIE